MTQLEKLGRYILDIIDYFFTHLGDEDFMFSFLAICVLILVLSVFMAIRQAKKKGGMLDIQGQKFANWKPFHFIEDYLGIEVPQKIRFTDIFRHGLQEDYFYTQVSKKLNLPEHKQYLAIRDKIRVYEKKWIRLLWALPFILLIIYAFIPLTENLKYILMFVSLGLLFLCITKLQAKPFKEELIPLQMSIIKKMYKHLFKKDFPNDMIFEVKLTKVNKARTPSNYIDLEQVIEKINRGIDNRTLQIKS